MAIGMGGTIRTMYNTSRYEVYSYEGGFGNGGSVWRGERVVIEGMVGVRIVAERILLEAHASWVSPHTYTNWPGRGALAREDCAYCAQCECILVRVVLTHRLVLPAAC